jgi:predicted dehydrogenase
VTANWREVTSDRSIDGIILATPPSTHCEMALAAIEAGTPVLVEKPMTLSLQEAHAIAGAATAHGVLTMIGHTHLFSSAFRNLKRVGESLGPLRDICSAAGNWGPFRPDTPMLWDWGPHDIAMCIDLFGRPPTTVDVVRIGTEGEGEAIAIALEFEPKGRAEIKVSNIEPRKQRVFEATFACGTLVYDDLSDDKLVLRRRTDGVAESIPIDSSLPLTNVAAEFCPAIETGQTSSPSLQLGLQVVEVLTACQIQLDHASC